MPDRTMIWSIFNEYCSHSELLRAAVRTRAIDGKVRDIGLKAVVIQKLIDEGSCALHWSIPDRTTGSADQM